MSATKPPKTTRKQLKRRPPVSPLPTPAPACPVGRKIRVQASASTAGLVQCFADVPEVCEYAVPVGHGHYCRALYERSVS